MTFTPGIRRSVSITSGVAWDSFARQARLADTAQRFFSESQTAGSRVRASGAAPR
ncbi:hypothetical protein [Kribbella sp. ALI-6-A]|uniref:hypothetical protein n=1 Tax=Kribbella sp. ALI-6-A TaxID=1933817 RepID=UPI00143E07D4|nr:hypothetical protein [Kribbella sp. ALI-6-A]